MKITLHEKQEWARFGKAVATKGYLQLGALMLAYSQWPYDLDMPVETFDRLQNSYRNWLVFNKVEELV